MNLYSEEARRQGFSVPLHAMRGLAAIIVLLGHVQVRADNAFNDFMFTRIFNASGVVVFFYVLSGLVVGASLAKVGISYASLTTFFHRRFFRIMPLMFVTVTLGGLYLLYIDPHMKYPLNPKEYGEFGLLKFIASYVGYSLKPNVPIWSIFVELVATLLIPLMILSGNKISNIVLAAIGCVLLSLIPIEFQHRWNFYMISFYLGLTVLVWGRWLADRLAGLSNNIFWILVALLFVSFYLARPITDAGFGEVWIVYWETAFVTPLVAIIYYMPERFSFFNAGFFKFFGDISFSLYLTHYVFLAALLNVIIEVFGTGALAVSLFYGIGIFIPIIVGTLSYRHIELKGMRLGEGLRRQFKPLPEVS